MNTIPTTAGWQTRVIELAEQSLIPPEFTLKDLREALPGHSDLSGDEYARADASLRRAVAQMVDKGITRKVKRGLYGWPSANELRNVPFETKGDDLGADVVRLLAAILIELRKFNS